MKVKSLLMLSVVVSLWGSSFVLLKLGLEEISPITLAFLRFLLALPFFAAVAYFSDRKVFDKSILREWKTLLLLGLTGITSYHVLQNVGLQFTTTSNSSLIISTNPVFITLLAHFYLKEEITKKRALGIILAFLGIILVIGPLRLMLNPKVVIGDLMSLAAGISWAFYSVFGKKILSNYGAHEVTMLSMLFGTIFLFPIMLISEKPSLPTSIWLWFLLLILGLLCSGLSYFLWYKALEEISATKVAVSIFLIPVVSVSIAHLILLEPLDASFIAGAFLVMAGVAITEKS